MSGKGYQWFRLYNDILNDPKIAKLDDHTFRGWVSILCVASKNDGKLPEISEVAFHLRCSEQDAKSLFEVLRNNNLIDQIDGHFVPHKWSTYQYKSDNSTERVQRHRKRQRSVTGNVPETAPESDSDTDSDSDSDTDSDTETNTADAADDGGDGGDGGDDFRRLEHWSASDEEVCELIGISSLTPEDHELLEKWRSAYAPLFIRQGIAKVLARRKRNTDQNPYSLRYFEGAIQDAKRDHQRLIARHHKYVPIT